VSDIAYVADGQHASLRAEVRRFAEERVRPRVAEMERGRGVDGELSREIAEQGWIGVTVHRDYGGKRGCPVREPAAASTAPPPMLAPVQKT
jgi:alkylation response protein AidB-like acyl-CoA dehydrogenase